MTTPKTHSAVDRVADDEPNENRAAARAIADEIHDAVLRFCGLSPEAKAWYERKFAELRELI